MPRIGKLSFGLYASKHYLARFPLSREDLYVPSTGSADARAHLSSDIWLIAPNDLTRISRIQATSDFRCELATKKANLLE